jgi:hypothetical protein
VLYVFGFETTGVVFGDLYFEDPAPLPGQEGPERGVRLEVRLLERGELRGNIYSAQPISVERPIWRVDLFEAFDGPPATFDRTHHHPNGHGWDLGGRAFDPELSADPVAWVGKQLGDLDELVAQSDVDPTLIDPADADSLRAAVPEILETLGRLLDRVHTGELGRPPVGDVAAFRSGWL